MSKLPEMDSLIDSAAINLKMPEDVVELDNPIDLSDLSPEEQELLTDFIQKIDLNDSDLIANYGSSAIMKFITLLQEVINNFEGQKRNNIDSKIQKLIAEIEGFDVPEDKKKGFWKIFMGSKNRVLKFADLFTSTSNSVHDISDSLKQNKVQTNDSIQLLEEKRSENLDFYKELTLYIFAGSEKLNEASALNEKLAGETDEILEDDSELDSGVSDIEKIDPELRDLFEKRLNLLNELRALSVRVDPQIKKILSSESKFNYRMQLLISDIIPQWENNMISIFGKTNPKQKSEDMNIIDEIRLTNKKLVDKIKEIDKVKKEEEDRLGGVEKIIFNIVTELQKISAE